MTDKLFDVEPIPPGPTRRLYMSNGGGDERYIRASVIDGYLTVEQLAAVCGVNANTARDMIRSRDGASQIATQIDGTWMIMYGDALDILRDRWGL